MEKTDAGKEPETRTPSLFKNRTFLIVAGSILLVAMIGTIYSAVAINKRLEAEFAAAEDEIFLTGSVGQDIVGIAEVLPQQRRDNFDDSYIGPAGSAIMDPFAEPMRLRGVTIGGLGGNMAIIESGGSAYIVSVGDYVDDLWAVTKITRGTAVLRAHNQEVSLFFDQPPVTRSLEIDPDRDDDDDAGEDEGEEGDN